MKIAKILSAAVAAVAASAAVALSASAELATVDPSVAGPALTSGTGMWMIKLYVPNEGLDAGIDCTQMGSVSFKIQAAEPEWFEGQTGGAVIVSSGPVVSVDHNWPQKNYWGVNDGDLVTVDETAALQTVALGDNTYELTCPVDDTNNVLADSYASDDAYVQVALSEWGSDMSAIKVLSMTVYDKDGNVMVAYDENGNVTDAAPAEDTAAPAEDETAATAEAPAAETAEDTAPAEDTTAAATADAEAPAATDSSKGSPDTGVAGVAAVAGVAVVAAGAVVLSKKRK